MNERDIATTRSQGNCAIEFSLRCLSHPRNLRRHPYLLYKEQLSHVPTILAVRLPQQEVRKAF